MHGLKVRSIIGLTDKQKEKGVTVQNIRPKGVSRLARKI